MTMLHVTTILPCQCICWSHVAGWHVADLVFFFLPVSNVGTTCLAIITHPSHVPQPSKPTFLDWQLQLLLVSFLPYTFITDYNPSTICLGSFSAICGMQPPDVESLSRSKARFQHRREGWLSQSALSNFSPTRGFDFAYWKIVNFIFQD